MFSEEILDRVFSLMMDLAWSCSGDGFSEIYCKYSDHLEVSKAFDEWLLKNPQYKLEKYIHESGYIAYTHDQEGLVISSKIEHSRQSLDGMGSEYLITL